VIKHLLSQADIDVNSVNSAGLTPLDVLLVSNHEMGDLYIGENLRAAGGKTAKELGASEINIINTSPHKQITRTRSKTEETSKSIDKNLIVVATLVATVTFSAALNPPGGAIQMPFSESDREDPNWFRNWKDMDTIYPAGSPVYLWKLKKFFLYDYSALFTSVIVILFCLPGIFPRGKVKRKFLVLVLWCSIFFMTMAFNSALFILLYIDKNIEKFQWFYILFLIWIYFFALTSARLFLKFIISVFARVVCEAKKWLGPSWISSPACMPNLKRVIKWDLIKRISSFAVMVGITGFVGCGVVWAIYEVVATPTSAS
jgi:Domain of unknown function